MRQVPLDEQTEREIKFRQRYERLYPNNRPSYIGDILGELEDIKQDLRMIKQHLGLPLHRDP